MTPIQVAEGSGSDTLRHPAAVGEGTDDSLPVPVRHVAPTQTRSVLIVDDDAMVRAVLRRALESTGFVVTEAETGTEGVAEYRRNPTSLLVVDLILPDIDGVDVLLDLTWDYPDLEVVAISGGSGNLDFLDVAEKFGASGVLKKPFGVEQLLQIVGEIFGTQPRPDEDAWDSRRHPRFTARMPVSFAGEYDTGHGHLVDLSLGGCAVACDVVPRLGASLTMYLTIPNHPLPLLVHLASVCWTGDRKFGVRFVWVEPAAQQGVRETLRQIVTLPDSLR